MARKTDTACKTETEIFPTRLRELLSCHPVSGEKTSHQKLADALGVKRQTVSYYTQGQSSPEWKNLAKIAEYFHVSTDYLLGLSDVQSVSLNVRELHDKIGLSEAAANELWTLGKHSPRRIAALSRIMEHQNFRGLLDAIAFCSRFGGWKTYFEQSVAIHGESDNYNMDILASSDRAQNRIAAIYAPQYHIGRIADDILTESEKEVQTDG